jgi:pyrroloquinoline quinone (PQQ) biosynthesis protein C
MDMAVAALNERVVHDEIVREADAIYEECFAHPATRALQSFNTHLASRPLEHAELVTFLASMAAFNRHTVAGIAILAGRLSDEILPHLPTSGHEIGGAVLDAAVDEYGLRESVTHVELARQFAAHLGVHTDEVESRESAAPIALELGDALFGWYRAAPTAFALGVHTASEITSVQEFMAWHDIFLNFPEYRLSREAPEFEYMRAHFAHEPEHIQSARICVGRYLDVLPANADVLRNGARLYLDCYQRMFHELDTLIFK